MLKMLPSTDKELLNKLSYDIFAKPFEGNIAYIFYNDSEEIGFAYFDIDDTSVIKLIGILPLQRKKGYGDFFTRSIFFRLQQICRTIRVECQSQYYKKFGFKENDGGMEVSSKKLTFGNKCHC